MIRTLTATPRLPGVFFPARRAPANPELPPLDVAAFVGFAERGPLDLPVALDDPGAFQAIFGGELLLARDAGEQAVYAQLPGAVADFFANGGRRCYAVRVANRDPEPAAAARFAIPGLAGLTLPDLVARPANLAAASPGRWAARLALAVRLEATPLPVSRFTASGPRALSWSADSAPAALRRGDLLRLSYVDGRRFLAPISDVVRPANPLATISLELAGLWPVLGPADVPAGPVSAARLLGLDDPVELTVDGPLAAGSTALTLTIVASEAPPARGALIQLTLPQGDFLMSVGAIRTLGSTGSPPAQLIALEAAELVAVEPGDLPEASPPLALRSVERLRLGLQPRLDDALRPLIGDLAFGLGHPRFWGHQTLRGSSLLGTPETAPGEQRWLIAEPGMGEVRESLLRAPETPASTATTSFRQALAGLRPTEPLDQAALAGLLAPVDSADEGQLFLPVGMPSVLRNDDLAGPTLAGDDGLAALQAAAFLDPAFGRATIPPTLLATARERYDVQELRLLGLHSLIVVDEVALIAAPDAAQRPWLPAGPEPPPALPPAPPPPALDPCPERVSEFGDCERGPGLTSASPGHGPLAGGTAVVLGGTGFDQPELPVVRFGDREATGVTVESDGVLRCLVPAGAAPVAVDIAITTRGGVATLPDAFTYQAPSTQPALARSEAADLYDPALAPLLAVHGALLTICQARQDAMALLALPAHFTKRDCIAWQQALRASLGLPIRRLVGGDTETVNLSYGAVYHPWLLRAAPGAAGGLRAGAPEGAVAGQLAARERERGVWVASANQPLRGVLGLTPELNDADWAELFALQFNLIRLSAREFRPLSAHTLSDERSLLQIAVRRLLILLRKAAVSRGMEFVFERNSERFREGVRVLLTRMLLGLYERGAFAGATTEQSFRVDTGPALNPPASVDQGRFVAEIRVAPSQPAEFISVVLTNTAEGQLRADERG